MAFPHKSHMHVQTSMSQLSISCTARAVAAFGSLLLLSLPLSRGNPGNSQRCSPPPPPPHANHRLSKEARQAEHMMLEHPCTAPLAALLYRHYAEALNMTFTPSAVPCRGIRRKLLCVHAQGSSLFRNPLGGSAPHGACQCCPRHHRTARCSSRS